VFGWLSDKIGGSLTIAVVCLDCMLLWGLMLLHPGYPALMALVALFGLNLAGVVPAFTLTLTKIFPPEMFGTAFGIGSFTFMALSPCMAPIAGKIFVQTGTYTEAILLLIAVLGAGALLAFTAGAARQPSLQGQDG
jgi:MFS family permease